MPSDIPDTDSVEDRDSPPPHADEWGNYKHLRRRASSLYRDFLSTAGCGRCGEKDPQSLVVMDEPAPECPHYPHDAVRIVVRCTECAPAFPDDYIVMRLERLAASASPWAAVYECEAVEPLGVDLHDDPKSHSCGADIVGLCLFDSMAGDEKSETGGGR